MGTKTALWLMSMGTKIKNLSVTYYQHDCCKSSRKFIIYHCWQNITLCIGKRLEQTGIETIKYWQQQKLFLSRLFAWLYQWIAIKKPFGKMQVTRGTKNQALRNWRQEGAWQSQIYKKRIPVAFTFCHLCGFWKRST